MVARLTEFANEWANKIYLENEVSVEIKVSASYRCEPFGGNTFRITIPRTVTEKAVKKQILFYIMSAYFQDPDEDADSEEERLELGVERITDVMFPLIEKIGERQRILNLKKFSTRTGGIFLMRQGKIPNRKHQSRKYLNRMFS